MKMNIALKVCKAIIKVVGKKKDNLCTNLFLVERKFII